MRNATSSHAGKRRPRRVRELALALCGLLSGVVWADGAGATTVLPTTLSQMCAQADNIFVGTVTEVRSQWAGADARRIETFVTFSDLRVLSGTPAETITLRFAGGRMGDVVESVAEMPTFLVGERVLLFAYEGRYVSPIVGFHQGCFRVIGTEGHERVLNANWLPVKSFQEGMPVAGESRSDVERAVRLSTLVDRIRDELAGVHEEEERE